MRFTAETNELLEMQNFTSAITYPFPDGLTSDSLSPPPASVRTGGRTLTKFSWMDRLPNFLSYGGYGAPL